MTKRNTAMMEQDKRWLLHRKKWLRSNQLSMPMNNSEHRVGSFLATKECESLEYFSEAVKELEDFTWNRPGTNNKYLMCSDAELMTKILKTFNTDDNGSK